MRVACNNFKGLIPKVSDRLIPDTNATVALNTRLRSGDLEPYNDFHTEFTFDKGATVDAIYPIDREQADGGPFWLNWNTSDTAPDTGTVDVIRGPIPQDTQERTYFTGALDYDNAGNPVTSPNTLTSFRPKVTTISKAITGVSGNRYPKSWLTLGIPPPVHKPVITQTYDPSSTVVTTSDGSSLSGWSQGTTDANRIITVVSSTATSVIFPPPNSGFLTKLYNKSGAASPTYMFKDIGVGNSGSLIYGVQFNTQNPNPPDSSEPPTGNVSSFIYFGCNATGHGYYVAIRFTASDTSWRIYTGTSTTWGVAGTETLVYTISIGSPDVPSQALSFDMTLNSDSTYTVVIKYGQGVSNTSLPPASGVPNVTIATLSHISTFGGNVGFSVSCETNPTGYFFLSRAQTSALSNISDSTETTYVYTFVNEFGEEGPPSDASDLTIVAPSIVTTVRGFDTFITRPSTGLQDNTYSTLANTKIRLYRANTGSQATQYQFVTEFAIGTTTYVDSKSNDELGETLQTALYDLPPEDGRNIVILPNGITLLSSKNQICPSVQYQPFAYPESYRLAVDFPVIAMGGIETTCIVLSHDSAYLVVGSDPSVMSMSKITSVYGCVSKRSVTRWAEYGIAYASQNGLVVINPSGATLITEQFTTKKEWQQINPSSIIGEVHENIYYGTYTTLTGATGSFLFDPRDEGNGFVDLGIKWKASFVDHLTDSLYVSDSGVLKRWNYSDTPLTYTWRSKVFQLPYPSAMNGAQIRGVNANGLSGTCTFNVYKNRETVPYFTKSVTTDQEFVMPPTIAKEIQLEIVGTAKINMIQVAEDMEELQ